MLQGDFFVFLSFCGGFFFSPVFPPFPFILACFQGICSVDELFSFLFFVSLFRDLILFDLICFLSLILSLWSNLHYAQRPSKQAGLNKVQHFPTQTRIASVSRLRHFSINWIRKVQQTRPLHFPRQVMPPEWRPGGSHILKGPRLGVGISPSGCCNLEVMKSGRLRAFLQVALGCSVERMLCGGDWSPGCVVYFVVVLFVFVRLSILPS